MSDDRATAGDDQLLIGNDESVFELVLSRDCCGIDVVELSDPKQGLPSLHGVEHTIDREDQ